MAEYDYTGYTTPRGGWGTTTDDAYVIGDDANNLIWALGGDDNVSGGKGDDVMWGGAGSDYFFFDTTYDNGKDIIKDFTVGEDMVAVTDGVNIDNFKLEKVLDDDSNLEYILTHRDNANLHVTLELDNPNPDKDLELKDVLVDYDASKDRRGFKPES